MLIAYTRVSTEDQNLGVDAQRASIEGWALAHGQSVAAWHADKLSGSLGLERRPGLLAAIAAVGKGDTLIVAKRDRIARDTIVSAMVDRMVARAGGTVVSADGAGDGAGPEAQLMRRIMDAFAEYERLIIRSRTKAALGALKSSGKRAGQLPFGFDADGDGNLVPNEHDQRIIAEVLAMRARGFGRLKMAGHFRESGKMTFRGTALHPTTIERILAAQS